jgi:ParB-like chromosome segregation protein Spo0J
VTGVLDTAQLVDIAAIQVGQRHRRDMGDVPGLAKNIVEIGLLHPLAVTPDMRLIAGERRLRACQLLGWAKVPVHVVDLAEIVRGELSENAERKDFLPSEIDAIRRAVEPLEKAAARERMTLGKRAPGSAKGRVRDKVGAFAGRSGRAVEQIAAIMAAAERDPERFGPLVAEMDRVDRVVGPYRKLRRMEDEARVQELVVQPGRYRGLLLDPPWDYDWLSESGRSRPGYAVMTQEQLLALPVAEWADLAGLPSLPVHAQQFPARCVGADEGVGLPAQAGADLGEAKLRSRRVFPQHDGAGVVRRAWPSADQAGGSVDTDALRGAARRALREARAPL